MREITVVVEKNDERDLAQKIIQLLDDPALRTKMDRFGRNRVESELERKYATTRLLAAYDLVFASGLHPHKG